MLDRPPLNGKLYWISFAGDAPNIWQGVVNKQLPIGAVSGRVDLEILSPSKWV